MFTLVAILVYGVAIAIPTWLLYRFGSESWYWHVLSILGALALGLLPMTPSSTHLYDMGLGFAFVALIVWGVGGLFSVRPHHPKHA